MHLIPSPGTKSLDWRTMSQFASRNEKHPYLVSPFNLEEERSRQRAVRRPQKRNRAGSSFSRMGDASIQETPLGAIRVDASGTVVEHRLPDAGDSLAKPRPIVGQQIRSIAPWAQEPAFLSAMQAAINSGRASFHLDFKTPAKPMERLIHVNILAVGDKTAWIFISDKTLDMIS